MYHRQNANNNQKPFQTIQLNSLKKKTTPNLLTTQNNKLYLGTGEQPVNILSILALYHFTSSPQPSIDMQIFSTMSFQQCPKAYQSLCHQKTMQLLLKLIVDNSESQQSLIYLINQYTVINFVLQAYLRASCINFVKSKSKCDSNSEKELLENFSIDLRGNMLDLVADCLEMQVTLVCGEFVETYGQEKLPKKLQLTITPTCIEFELTTKKLTHTKANQPITTKTLKHINTQQTQPSQSHQISTIQTPSLLKDSISSTQLGKCEKCKMIKNKCYCSKRILGSTYTPSSATKFQRTSINAGLAANIVALGSQHTLNQMKTKCTCNKMFCTCSRR